LNIIPKLFFIKDVKYLELIGNEKEKEEVYPGDVNAIARIQDSLTFLGTT